VGIKANTGEIEMNAPRISRHETEYTATMARIDELMDAELGTSEGEELDRLTDRAIQYEFTEGDEHKLANAAPLSLLIRGLIDSVDAMRSQVADLKNDFDPRILRRETSTVGSVSQTIENRFGRIIVAPGEVLLVKVDDDTFRDAMQNPNINRLFDLIGIWQDQIGAPVIIAPESWEITAIAAPPTERKPPERIIEL
jgi:antitoxin component HigA of HigAB toxin-antitoxin module